MTHRRVHGLVTHRAGAHRHAVVVVTLAYDGVHRAQVVLTRRGVRTLRHSVAEVNEVDDHSAAGVGPNEPRTVRGAAARVQGDVAGEVAGLGGGHEE